MRGHTRKLLWGRKQVTSCIGTIISTIRNKNTSGERLQEKAQSSLVVVQKIFLPISLFPKIFVKILVFIYNEVLELTPKLPE